MQLISVLSSAVLVALAALIVVGPALGLDEENEVLRWSSAGGSFRNLITNIAYANVFAKAGLFGQEPFSSKFTALSGQSGGSWFAALFFYSNDFYNITTTSNPDELADVVGRAMGAYRDYSDVYYEDDPICSFLGMVAEDYPNVDNLVGGCGLLLALDGNWAALNDGAVAAIAKDFGIAGLESIPMGIENRVEPLASTDMYLQMTLFPSSRVRNKKGIDSVSYLGPKDDENTVYATPIDVQYSVTDTYADYISNTPGGRGFPSEMVTYMDVKPLVFPFTDAKTYEIYPGKKGKVTADKPETATLAGSVRPPFGGLTPTISQITGASTSVPGFYASSVPSTFAQVFSTFLGPYPGKREAVFAGAQAALTPVYATSKLDELAVCSQWPMADCDERDVRLADGYAADAPTLALNIGQYQTIQNGDLSKTIKLILTPPNSYGKNNPPLYLMSYFNTSFNQGVDPGDFLWPSPKLIVPLRSPQIFDMPLELEEYYNLLKPVKDINVMDTLVHGIDLYGGAGGIDEDSVLSTARIQTTTIENEAYLVKAGQKVDILILQLSSDIPLAILGVEAIDMWTEPLQNLIREISNSAKLLEIVEDFVGDDR